MKILLSFSAHLWREGAFRIGCFYEGFISSLAEEGNQLLILNGAEFLHQSLESNMSGLPKYIDKNLLVRDIKTFAPELVIAFNHCIPREVEEACECPIVLWDSDSIPFWHDRDYVKANLSRYTFFGFSYESIDNARNFGVSEKQNHMVRPGTSVKAETLPLRQNISFIGSNFHSDDNFLRNLREGSIPELRRIADSYVGNFYKAASTILANQVSLEDLTMSSLSSIQNRVTALNSVQDLGLTIWGVNWIEVGRYLPWLAMCYNKDTVYSVKHNQDIYNSSKLCISISHAQATQGFPWRVMDIMASNGALVSDYRSGIAEFTKGYVDIPMYDSPYDARDLCKKLLQDESWRQDVVLGSQQCIKEKGRWQHRFRDIEQILGISLLRPSSEPESEAEAFAQEVRYMRPDIYQHQVSVVPNLVRLLSKFMPMWMLKAGYRILNRLFNVTVDSGLVAEIKNAQLQSKSRA